MRVPHWLDEINYFSNPFSKERTMKFIKRLSLGLIWIAAAATAFAQQYDPQLFSAMKWRLVGPHRAGRVTAVAGIPGNAAIYYFGTPGGGLWKTADGGRVWKPIFDDVHVASIGSVAVAPSNPNIVYVGTGEQLIGHGVYKSSDAGKTWTNVGLTDAHHISLFIDPKDPKVVLVGSYDFLANAQHGIFKTTDGGKTWQHVFFKDENTSVVDMAAAPDDFRIVYAATTAFRFANGRMIASESSIVKSTDAGAPWHEASDVLPANPRGRIGVAVAPGTSGKRVYAIMS